MSLWGINNSSMLCVINMWCYCSLGSYSTLEWYETVLNIGRLENMYLAHWSYDCSHPSSGDGVEWNTGLHIKTYHYRVNTIVISLPVLLVLQKFLCSQLFTVSFKMGIVGFEGAEKCSRTCRGFWGKITSFEIQIMRQVFEVSTSFGTRSLPLVNPVTQVLDYF
jgi:hypothetical protein